MGYSHSWEWNKRIADPLKFARWCGDVIVLLAYYYKNPPAQPTSDFLLDALLITGNAQRDVTICGPGGDCHPIFRPDRVSFNGNRATKNECEAFTIRATDLEHGCHSWCKTWANPYDLLVCAALVRFEHYFPQIKIQCGGGAAGLDAAAMLNQMAFGEVRNPLRDPIYQKFVGYEPDEDD